jgi:hypothetical protein
MGISAPVGLPLRFQLRQRVRKARPFEQLPRANLFVRQPGLFELQINATTSRVDSNSLLRGGNADYHTGLI